VDASQIQLLIQQSAQIIDSDDGVCQLGVGLPQVSDLSAPAAGVAR
jgi:hypothetical protein